ILFPSLSAITSPTTSIALFAPNLALGLILTWGLHFRWGVQGVVWAHVVTNVMLSASFLAMFRWRFHATVRSFLVLRREDVQEPLTAICMRIRRLRFFRSGRAAA